jgi:thiamine-phosphate pyrophosphorylase
MPQRQPVLPKLWLISDARNDAVLEASLARLPRGSGFIYRHYHLEPQARRARFAALKRIARRYGHRVVLAGSATQARQWRADGAYGSPRALARGPAILRLITTHDLREIGCARRASAILLSPVFVTASHPGGRTLGVQRFRALAMRARVPVVALGGMTVRLAWQLKWVRWAAIDGLTFLPGQPIYQSGPFPLVIANSKFRRI